MGKRNEETVEKKETGFVTINSSVTVRVYPGIFYENASNNDTRIGDRLKVIEKWSKFGLLIKEGVNEVAAEVAEWPTVKAMIEAKKMAIVGKSETTSDEKAIASKELAEEAEETKTSLEEISK